MKKITLITMMILLITMPVFANGLPTYEEGENSGMVSIDENSSIQLIEETVIYNIGNVYNDSDSYLWGINNQVERDITAEITVTYRMKSDVDEDTNMYFMLPNIDSGYITVDGENLDDIIYTEDVPQSIDWQPSSVQNYEVRDLTFETAQIPLSFKAGQEKTLVIHYIPSSGYNRSGKNVNGVFDFTYFLTPAKFWLGDTKVNLFVNLDDNVTFKSNIELSKSSDSSYSTSLDKIPDIEWFLEVSHKNYRIFGTNNAWIHNGILLLLFLLIYKSHRLFPQSSYKKLARIVTYVLCSILWYKLNVDSIGYPFGPLFVWAGYIILYLMIPIAVYLKRNPEY